MDRLSAGLKTGYSFIAGKFSVNSHFRISIGQFSRNKLVREKFTNIIFPRGFLGRFVKTGKGRSCVNWFKICRDLVSETNVSRNQYMQLKVSNVLNPIKCGSLEQDTYI